MKSLIIAALSLCCAFPAFSQDVPRGWVLVMTSGPGHSTTPGIASEEACHKLFDEIRARSNNWDVSPGIHPDHLCVEYPLAK